MSPFYGWGSGGTDKWHDCPCSQSKEVAELGSGSEFLVPEGRPLSREA
jgi:hypothetical protein